MEIFYEDLVENFDNNLREKLMKLVNEHKIIIVKGLNSAERYMIYRQMYYPLKFEKIIQNDNQDNTDIRIYNCKIKQKETEKETKKETKETKETEKTKKKIKKEDEYILEDSENSEEENSSDSEYEESESEEDSYITEEDEQLTRLENIGSQIMEKMNENNNNINKTKRRINLVILINIIGWIIFCMLDPVRIIYIRSEECQAF